jgi:hypothetical protein
VYEALAMPDGNPQQQLPIGLNLSNSGITGVSALGNVHALHLRDCRGITDVSALGSVHTLYLSYCEGITDVSALGSVNYLDLSYCTGITDVSILVNMRTLFFSHCHENITSVTALMNSGTAVFS